MYVHSYATYRTVGTGVLTTAGLGCSTSTCGTRHYNIVHGSDLLTPGCAFAYMKVSELNDACEVLTLDKEQLALEKEELQVRHTADGLVQNAKYFASGTRIPTVYLVKCLADNKRFVCALLRSA